MQPGLYLGCTVLSSRTSMRVQKSEVSHLCLLGILQGGYTLRLGMCIKKKLITESKKYYLRNQQQIN